MSIDKLVVEKRPSGIADDKGSPIYEYSIIEYLTPFDKPYMYDPRPYDEFMYLLYIIYEDSGIWIENNEKYPLSQNELIDVIEMVKKQNP